jgi:hypothetical protein
LPMFFQYSHRSTFCSFSLFVRGTRGSDVSVVIVGASRFLDE